MLDPDQASDSVPAPPNLKKRVDSLVREAGSDLLGVKAGLERWFDESMGRLEGAYKRWAMMWLVLVGFVIAVAANASTFDVAEKLWHDPVTRQAVAEAAGRVADEGANPDITSVADATNKLKELGLPIGWDKDAETMWADGWKVWNWGWSHVGTALGWVLTALLVMLGAPFWFDVLSKLGSLRSAGTKPPAATEDQASATASV
jgi:hypothetical protein